jgi:filamentous hemagglutinin
MAAPGSPAETLVVQGLREEGINVVGEQVTVRGLISTRRYDAVVLDSRERLWGIEVKSGTAAKTPLQELNDLHVQNTRDAVILGDGPLAGQKIFGVQTVYVK